MPDANLLKYKIILWFFCNRAIKIPEKCCHLGSLGISTSYIKLTVRLSMKRLAAEESRPRLFSLGRPIRVFVLPFLMSCFV